MFVLRNGHEVMRVMGAPEQRDTAMVGKIRFGQSVHYILEREPLMGVLVDGGHSGHLASAAVKGVKSGYKGPAR